ncbi:MAG TPA: hypothetical protein VD905_08090 [Flavobacteriales bacterium]|nr:hypothetical protein [Flavobacteriales bacterium]
MENDFEIDLTEYEHFMLNVIMTPLNEKIFFKADDPNLHYTIHFGAKSKILDIHIKNEALEDSDPNKYTSVLKIRHFTLLRFILILRDNVFEKYKLDKYFYPKGHLKVPPSELLVKFLDFVKTYQINLGKIRRTRSFTYDISETSIKDYNKLLTVSEKKHKAKLKLVKKVNASALQGFVLDLKNKRRKIGDGLYPISRINKNGKPIFNGLLLAITTSGRKRYYYFSKKTFNRSLNFGTRIIVDSLEKINFFNKEYIIGFLKNPKSQNFISTKLA